jgi:hypothetical protein
MSIGGSTDIQIRIQILRETLDAGIDYCIGGINKPTAYERGIGDHARERERDWPNTNTNAFMTLRMGHLDGAKAMLLGLGLRDGKVGQGRDDRQSTIERVVSGQIGLSRLRYDERVIHGSQEQRLDCLSKIRIRLQLDPN